MKSNIKFKHFLSLMKTKYMIFLLCFLLLFVNNSYGAILVYDQETTLNNYQDNSLKSMIFETINPALNSESIGNYTGDYKIEITGLQDSFFITIENFNAGTNLEIVYFFDNSPSSYLQEFTLNETGLYIFEIDNSFNGESGSILINGTNNIFNAFLSFSNENAQDINIFEPLINGVVDLIEINLSIWKIFYYLFISAIIIGVIGVIIWIGFKFYEWSSKVDIYNKKNSRK